MKPKKFIAIHSVPRSGSSWLGEIINSSANVKYCFQPLFSYAFKSALDECSTKKQIEKFYLEIGKTEDDFINQKKERERGEKPVFIKENITHIAYKEVRYHYILENLLKQTTNFKSILLIRNPLSVLNSFKNAPKEFRSDLGWKFENEWRYAQSKNEYRNEEYFGYEKWKEAAFLFLYLKRKYPRRVLLVNFKSMLDDVLKVTNEIFDFLELELSRQTTEFICVETKANNNPYSVFKNKAIDNDWMQQLPQNITEYIQDDLKNTPLQEYLA